MGAGSPKPISPRVNAGNALQAAARHCERRQFHDAEAICRQILQIDPDNAGALHVLGVVAHQLGRHDAAADLFRRALKRQPASPSCHCNLGTALLAQGKVDEAAKCFRQALRFKPDYAEAHNNLGVTLMRQGNLATACEALRRALAIRPDYAQAHYNLGLVQQRQGDVAESISSFERALEVMPNHADAHNDLGAVLQEEGRLDEAAAHFESALRLNPNHAGAHNNLGTALLGAGRFDDAVAHYEQALRLAPELANVHFNLGRTFLESCRLDQAIACFERARQIEPSARNKIATATAMSPIIASSLQLVADRERVACGIKKLLAEDLDIADPLREGLSTNYLLAYHGLDDRPSQEAMARVLLNACPSLSWTAPHCRGDRNATHEAKIRIGFVSRYFYNHTVGEVMRGLIEHLDRRRFEVTILRLGEEQDHIARSIDGAADHLIRLPNSLHRARNMVAEQRLHVLVYPEVGMDPCTYFLAFSRLARLQCVMWGHPDTTGIPNIDCFLSAVDVEPENAQEQYSEKLITLERMPTYYYRPRVPREVPDRGALGLPVDAHLYVCPQTLYKLHPDFDEAVGAILRRDPQGVLVLFHGRHPSWSKALTERFSRTLSDVVDRVLFLPRLALDRYFSVLLHASVVLDTFHFGGGNTAYQALGLGVPVVTRPGAFARSRVTYALYKRMGMMDLVSDSVERYVEMATRLATDSAFREEIGTAIRGKSDVVFEDLAAVREFEEIIAGLHSAG